MRILIANRGEIARRIARTAFRLGHDVIGITTVLDDGAVHAAELEAVVVDSYLDGESIVAVAREHGADAIHPGYGFLAENAEFARSVVDAGLTWIGPRPAVIDQMGSKINARAIAEAAGVPVIPGYAESQEDADLRGAAERIGFPVLVKASAGGGGKGIRIAHDADRFDAALSEARAEAYRSFGDGSVIVERYVQRPRHIEVQIMGDLHGTICHLGTRECSVQRRYQKLFEEAPAPNLPEATRLGLHASAVRLAASVGYDSAGTVEFVVDDDTGDYFFLEMNTRLQVEHPVTELVTGVDLVELMITVAANEPLPPALADVEFVGHALEARIAAEDAGTGFVPSVGVVRFLRVPDGVRWDSAVVEGSPVTPHFDSMIAKLIVAGSDRDDALARMRAALEALLIGGVATIAGFHRWLVDQPALIAGRVTTRLLDESVLPADPAPAVDAAAAAWLAASRAAEPPTIWHARPDFSVTTRRPAHPLGLRGLDGEVHEVVPDLAATPTAAHLVDLARRQVVVNVAGHSHWFEVPTRTERWAAHPEQIAGSGDALVAPFPAIVIEVHVAPGDVVAGGDVLIVIEAMKMLHSLSAHGTSMVDEVRVAPGDQVASGQPLVTFVVPTTHSTSELDSI